MPRYPANYAQDLDAETLKRLPKFATYEGDAPDLKHLRGLVLETATVEQLVYPGERDNVFVEDEDGTRHRPWRFVEIVELDANGSPVIPPVEPIPERGPDAMSSGDLGALGMTDQDLIDLAKSELGEVYEPDRPGPSDLRRSIYNRVMAAIHG
jgi:hypothetical protein